MTKDYGGYDALDYLRDLLELHADSLVAKNMRHALWKVADNMQDGAPDAGSVAHACTHIASLLRQDMDL